MARQSDDATSARSSENEVFDADFERPPRARSDGRHDDGTALDTLKRAVRRSFDLARRPPAHEAFLLGGPEFGRAKGALEDRTPFEMLWSHVRAAQRAGELKAADAMLMTALIVGSVLGAADLAQYALAEQQSSIDDGECPALLLLDLLTAKRCN